MENGKVVLTSVFVKRGLSDADLEVYADAVRSQFLKEARKVTNAGRK